MSDEDQPRASLPPLANSDARGALPDLTRSSLPLPAGGFGRASGAPGALPAPTSGFEGEAPAERPSEEHLPIPEFDAPAIPSMPAPASEPIWQGPPQAGGAFSPSPAEWVPTQSEPIPHSSPELAPSDSVEPLLIRVRLPDESFARARLRALALVATLMGLVPIALAHPALTTVTRTLPEPALASGRACTPPEATTPGALGTSRAFSDGGAWLRGVQSLFADRMGGDLAARAYLRADGEAVALFIEASPARAISLAELLARARLESPPPDAAYLAMEAKPCADGLWLRWPAPPVQPSQSAQSAQSALEAAP